MAEDTIAVTRDDHDVCKLPCERIPLEYPELSGRAEACMGRTQNGDIWVAVGYNTGGGGAGVEGVERLFCSQDGGRRWTSRLLPPTERGHLGAFTVLQNDRLLLAVGGADGASIEFYGSNDQGKSWEPLSRLSAEPFERIGEGFLSLTQLRDGTVLFPVCRWQKAPEGTPVEFPQYVFRSSDGGRTWQGGGALDPVNVMPEGSGPTSRWPGMGGTFPGCCETHITQLRNGRLLAAFRYSGYPQPWHRAKIDEWGGGNPDGIGRIFKQVFLGDSFDGGKTWQNLRPLLSREGRPLLKFGQCHGQVVQVPDGRVVLVHDHRYPYDRTETVARVSEDGGQTWSTNAYHVSEGTGYPASVALEDGTLVTVTGNTRLNPDASPAEPWRVQAICWKLPDNA